MPAEGLSGPAVRCAVWQVRLKKEYLDENYFAPEPHRNQRGSAGPGHGSAQEATLAKVSSPPMGPCGDPLFSSDF